MARIDLKQLNAFLAVVRLGSVSMAAQALNVTQPAITTRIKNLQETLGVVLLERSDARFAVTKQGNLLIHYAEQIENLVEKINAEIMDPSQLEGHLKIGVSETIAQCWLPDFIAAIHRKYPGIQIEINVDISLSLRRDLKNRKIDLAMLLGPISDFSVNNVELPDFDLAWYKPISIKKNADLAHELFHMPVITYARDTRPFRELKAVLIDKYGPSVALFPSSSLLACFRLVEVGLGVAALPRLMGQEFVNNGSVEEFNPGWVPNPLKFTASYLGEPKSHMVETAAQLAKEVAESYYK